MGAKVTIDSASLMNKGFEVIEARWLFGVDAGRIDVVIHPGSVVHSMVQFRDGAVKAQIGTPDMHLPIQYALTYPQRLPLEGRRLDFCELGTLEFRRPDTDRFPNLALAYECLRRGGCAGAVLNAANEVGVAAFWTERSASRTSPASTSRRSRECLKDGARRSNSTAKRTLRHARRRSR